MIIRIHGDMESILNNAQYNFMQKDNLISPGFNIYVERFFYNLRPCSPMKISIVRSLYVLEDLRHGFSIEEIDEPRLVALMAVLSKYLRTTKGNNDATAQRLFTMIRYFLNND